MIHVLKREFIDSFKSVRSILIILFLTLVAYFSAKFFKDHQAVIHELINSGEGLNVDTVYAFAVSFIVLAFGFLFVFAVSHDMINNETETKTIRLLVTKTSRLQIMLGKLFGTALFWIATISITYAVIFLISGSWSMKEYTQTLILLFYFVCFALFISTIIPKTKLSMFLGILLGIALPIIDMISLAVDKWYLIPAKYVLPFYYTDHPLYFMLIPLAIGLAFFVVSVFIMERRDL